MTVGAGAHYCKRNLRQHSLNGCIDKGFQDLIANKTKLEGVFLIENNVLEDDRGFFLENYKASVLNKRLREPHRFAQSNHSRSQANTLRGFRKEPWNKLIYVVHGTALCVVVDTRPDSETFGQSETFLMGDSPGKRNRLYVPTGVSNAFYCLTEVDYFNDVSGEFEPSGRFGFRWNDPDVAVEWPCEDPVLSDTDKAQPFLRDLFPEHPFFEEATNTVS